MSHQDWRDIPLGHIRNDALLSRCIALAKLRPDFAEAFGALLASESLELYAAWQKYYTPPEPEPSVIVYNVPSRMIDG